MKLFVIPSWYPSASHPSTGIFFKEQAQIIARKYPDWKLGISLWGSHEPDLWIRVLRPLDAIFKLTSKVAIRPYENMLESNCVEFFTPAFTWTRHLMNGNIKGIIKANKTNLDKYILNFGKPDLIQADISFPAGKVAMELSKMYGIPYIIKEQMSPFPLPSFKNDFKKMLLPQLRTARSVLSVGSNLTKELKEFGIEAEQTINFIDLDCFIPSKQSFKDDVITIFALGRLVEQKGFDMLIDAMGKLQIKNWILRIGGSGPLHKKLLKQAKRRGLDSNVKFIGSLNRAEVIEEMQQCDFFVLSSRHESFGVVVIEALACGKPLVYTKCGGITDQLPDEVGISSEISVVSIQNAIDSMLTQYKKYDPQTIRKFVETYYSPKKVVDQLTDIISTSN